jgi:hypothetical protein
LGSETRVGADLEGEAGRGSSSSKERAEEEGQFRPHEVIGILDQVLKLSELQRVWQEAEMMEMQRRTNYDGSHHGMPARCLGPS